MRLPAETMDRLLDTWPVGILASVGSQGQPHQVPVVFARVGSRLWSPVDGKPKAAGELGRVRNLRSNPRASLLLDHYDEDWTRLWWLRVDLNARVFEPPDPDADPEVMAAVAALRGKYPQYHDIPVLRAPATLLALDPVAVTGWCASRDAISML